MALIYGFVSVTSGTFGTGAITGNVAVTPFGATVLPQKLVVHDWRSLAVLCR